MRWRQAVYVAKLWIKRGYEGARHVAGAVQMRQAQGKDATNILERNERE